MEKGSAPRLPYPRFLIIFRQTIHGSVDVICFVRRFIVDACIGSRFSIGRVDTLQLIQDAVPDLSAILIGTHGRLILEMYSTMRSLP